MDTHQALRKLVTAAVRFQAKAARCTRIEVEWQALREAVTEAKRALSVSGHKKATVNEPKPSPKDVREAGALLRSVPGPKAMRAEKAKENQRKRKE